jgi:hypothetical protein
MVLHDLEFGGSNTLSGGKLGIKVKLKIMESKFNLDNWDHLKPKLKKEFPQLTNADLHWRHETKNDLFKMIATKLGKTQKQFEEVVDTLDRFK